MYPSLFIFAIAFIVRLLNLYLNQINVDTYLIEDQIMYWDWSLKNAYTPYNSIEPNLLLERMPGSFLFFQIATGLVGENLFNILIIQIIVDAINCVVIAFIARTLNKSLFILAGLVSAFSPLMVIVSSQILSDTIFLFFFSFAIYYILNFVKHEKENLIYLGALFLGLALFTRVVVLPLIFLVPIFIFYISYREKYNILKIIRITSIFFIISFSLVAPRIFNNYNNYNTLSLTTQSGSHFAHWVLPAVLDFSSDERKNQYKENLEELNKKLVVMENPFDQSELLQKEAFNFLLATEKKLILLAWGKGAILNILGPPFVIDKRFRNLPHPSFYENDRNISKWLTSIFNNEEYNKYKILLCISTLFSFLFLLLSSYGAFLIYKNYFKSAVFFLIIILYFLAVTGPVFSPKYIHPIMPILIILEVLALKRFFEIFVKPSINTKRN